MSNFLAQPKPWGDKADRCTRVAIHLLLECLARSGNEVADVVPRLAEILGVVPRTIQRHLEVLREEGHLRGDSRRIVLTHRLFGDRPTRSPAAPDPGVAPKRSWDHAERHQDRSSDPGVVSSDPGVAVVAALTAAKLSEAKPASLAVLLDLVLEEAQRYVPAGPEGRALTGRAVSAHCADTRSCVADLLDREAARCDCDLAAAAEQCRWYVERYAALCRVDATQRRFWSARMFGVTISTGRRKAAWDVVRSAVDRAEIPATTAVPARVDGEVRVGRYGGGRREL